MGVSPLDTFASKKSTFLSNVDNFSFNVDSLERQLMSKELRKSAIRLMEPEIWRERNRPEMTSQMCHIVGLKWKHNDGFWFHYLMYEPLIVNTDHNVLLYCRSIKHFEILIFW